VSNPVKPGAEHPAALDLSGWGPGGRWFESSLPDETKGPLQRAFARDDELRPWQAMFDLCSILRPIEDVRVEAKRVRTEQRPLAASDLDGLD
jgi:hypothetical protein